MSAYPILRGASWGFLTLAAVFLVAGAVFFWPPKNASTGQSNSPPEIPAGPAWFADVTEQLGLDFVHDPGPIDQKFFMPQIVGSGAALFDCDGDGRLDIYLLNNGGPQGRPNVLYRQSPDGTFRDASRGSGLNVAGYCMGAAVGDVNNDGLPDVVVTEFGKVGLYVNLGDGKFAAASESGISSSLWGASACFLDFDRDGWLDLAVANYLEYDPAWPCTSARGDHDYCHPKVFPGAVAKLFRNTTGDQTASSADSSSPAPRFEDATISSGLAASPGPGLGIAAADFDGDGWPDIFIANDAAANHLWINRQDGTFEEQAVSRGVAYDAVGRSLANMGVALGDTHGSGLFDLFVTHLPEETHTLWRQQPPGLFADSTASSNLLRANWRGTGFGTVLADFDHDGRLDLAIANGRVVRSANPVAGDHWAAYAERNQVFAGSGPGQFRDISSDNPDLCGTPNVARALAVGDIDGDGALDLLVTVAGGRARVLRNVSPDRGHWLRVTAIDPRYQRAASGAQVTVVAGQQRRVAWVNPGQSFLASNDPRVHFGLGSTVSIDAIEVLWPDGLVESFPGGAVDRDVVVERGEGSEVAGKGPGNKE